MKVTTEPVFLPDAGAPQTITVVSGSTVTLCRGRRSATIATVTSGQSTTVDGPVWLVSAGSSEVRVGAVTPVGQIVALTQAAYDAIVAPDEHTLYVIVG